VPLIPTLTHVAPCPVCGYVATARSWDAVETALIVHVVYAHGGRVEANEHQ